MSSEISYSFDLSSPRAVDVVQFVRQPLGKAPPLRRPSLSKQNVLELVEGARLAGDGEQAGATAQGASPDDVKGISCPAGDGYDDRERITFSGHLGENGL